METQSKEMIGLQDAATDLFGGRLIETLGSNRHEPRQVMLKELNALFGMPKFDMSEFESVLNNYCDISEKYGKGFAEWIGDTIATETDYVDRFAFEVYKEGELSEETEKDLGCYLDRFGNMNREVNILKFCLFHAPFIHNK